LGLDQFAWCLVALCIVAAIFSTKGYDRRGDVFATWVVYSLIGGAGWLFFSPWVPIILAIIWLAGCWILFNELRTEGRPLSNSDAQSVGAQYSVPQPPHTDEGGEWMLSRSEWIASVDNPLIPAEGKWARFEYVDVDGVITEREIRNWSKRGAYIEGFCMMRRASRNFRQDRIHDWSCG
jgi:uncharacterized membrane protein